MTELKDTIDEAKKLLPSNIIYIGLVALMAISEWKSPSNTLQELTVKVIIIVLSFAVTTVFNSLYFRWYNKKLAEDKLKTNYPSSSALKLQKINAPAGGEKQNSFETQQMALNKLLAAATVVIASTGALDFLLKIKEVNTPLSVDSYNVLIILLAIVLGAALGYTIALSWNTFTRTPKNSY